MFQSNECLQVFENYEYLQAFACYEYLQVLTSDLKTQMIHSHLSTHYEELHSLQCYKLLPKAGFQMFPNEVFIMALANNSKVEMIRN